MGDSGLNQSLIAIAYYLAFLRLGTNLIIFATMV